MKIVVYEGYGTYELPECVEAALREVGLPRANRLPRHDVRLVSAVEQYLAGWRRGYEKYPLAVVEIPGSVYWIHEYDGHETVMTPESIPWVYA